METCVSNNAKENKTAIHTVPLFAHIAGTFKARVVLQQVGRNGVLLAQGAISIHTAHQPVRALEQQILT